MDLPVPITVTLLGGLATLIGYFVSNVLEHSSARRLREMEFRLTRYTEFLLAYGEVSGQTTFETQSRFVDSVNVILLIGGATLLDAIKDLVANFNDPTGTAEKQVPILERIVFQMRRDLNSVDSRKLEKFEFPLIHADHRLRSKRRRPATERDE